MARIAVEMGIATAGSSTLRSLEKRPAGRVRCLLEDKRRRQKELMVVFESSTSGRIDRISIRPILADGTEVRRSTRNDLTAMTELELAAPVQRDDGTEVVIDHNGQQFEHEDVVTDHRWLAVFKDGRMVAVQAVAVIGGPIGGKTYRFGYNHYSRSDPRTRSSGNLLYLIGTLYQDVFPVIDQFASIVDVRNPAGLRLSFGMPWPTRACRLFLPTRALAARAGSPPPRRDFDPRHAADLLNATHRGKDFWVPRTPEFLVQRMHRAPSVYGSHCWRLTANAALALWPSGERRTYRKNGTETTRSLALALDYGFAGESGPTELTGLLIEAARELVDRDITHVALFVSEGDPTTEWLTKLAEASDTYAICAPPLDDPPVPSARIYADHILF
jgi:hypothetical protein